MKRRDFLKSAGSVCGAGLLYGSGGQTTQANAASAVPGRQPNILFILVDELEMRDPDAHSSK